MITDYGILKAFNKEINKDLCENLLTLNITDTRITEKGIFIIFNNLINLNVLNHNKMNKAICAYSNNNYNDNELKINMINITYDDNLTPDEITTIFETCTNVEILKIDKAIVANHLLYELKYLTDFTLVWNRNIYSMPSYVNDFISKNHNLTNLVLIDLPMQVDISNIAVHCPNIENITVHQNIYNYLIISKYLTHENCFKKLQRIELVYSLSYNGNGKVRMGTDVLEAILSSPELSFVNLSSIDIPYMVMDSIIKKVHSDGLVFQNLINFHLPQSSIRLDYLKQIMLIAPKIKKVIFTCSLYEVETNNQILKEMQNIASVYGITLLFQQ
jgi:hypothetical protein